MAGSEKYYAPYLSDSDTGYTSDTSDTSTSSSQSRSSWSTGEETSVRGRALNPPNFRQFASGLQLTQAASPSFSTEEKVLNRRVSGLQMSPVDYQREKLDNLYLKKDASGADIEKTIDFSKQTITSIVMLDSRDRDKKIFLQPTNVTLRLPRPYKNITNFQIIQIKLLSSFFYFRADKNNISITIHEQGRYLPPGATSGPLNSITSYIREGTYNINTLIQELTQELNVTPIFYDYPGGFSQFAPIFASTGDYSLNFNQPGDYYYDALNNQFIQNPTMTQIVQKYFQTVNAGLPSYTLDQIKIAYYYPVLKEAILDATFNDTISFDIANTSALLPTETVRSRCIYTFQGLNDPIVLQVIDLNVLALDNYRLSHTFRYYLINKYTISYQTNNNRITITSTQLNTSLTNLLNSKYNQYLAEQLQQYNISQDQYNTLSTVNSLLLAILTDMYYYIQQQFSQYFAINFNSYSLPYYTNVFNQIPIQNGLNATGISSNYDAQVIAKNITPQSLNELSTFRTQPGYYWNRLNALSTTVNGYFNMNSNSTINTYLDYGRVFNNILDKQDLSTPLVLDSSPFSSNLNTSTATLYQNKLLHYADIVTNIEPTQYTTFRFKSPVRQTLRVAAFPRPTKYRYPAYNAVTYDAEKQRLFDNSYAFVENAQNSKMDVLYATSNLVTVPGFDSTGSNYFGSNFNTMYALWTSNVNLNIANTRTYFTFLTPTPPSAPVSKGYTYNLNISVVNGSLLSNFASPIQVFLYHDRGAFMADISDVRNEKPLHYLQSATYSNTTIGTLSLTAYAQQRYYLMVRSKDTTFSAVDFRLVAYYPNGTSYTSLTSTLTNFDPLANPLSNLTNYNYASLADSNFIRLPINQIGKNSNNGVDSNYTVFSTNLVKMGYDANGVSTDLTDYIGYDSASNLTYVNPNALYRVDPITGYIFQANSPYNSTTQQYFSAGSSNQLFTSNVASTYTPAIVSSRQEVLAHYYDGTFMMPLPTQSNIAFSSILSFDVIQSESVSSNIGPFPYTDATTLPGFITSNGDIDISQRSNVSKGRIPGYTYDTNPIFSYNYLKLGNGLTGISLIPDDGVWDVNRIMLKSRYFGDSINDPNRQIKYLGIYIASYVNSLAPENINLSSAYMVMELSTSVTYNSNTSNFGFATEYGTFYEWVRSKTYIPASNQYIYGYAQQISTMNTDSNAFYTILPFKSDGTLTTYTALSGTPTPYFPFYSVASTSTTYLDGSTTPEGKGVVYPTTRSNPDTTRGPPTGGNPTQAKYERSIPITNSVLQYLNQEPFYTGISSLSKYGPSSFLSNTGLPTFADSEFRVNGYALFNRAGVYDIYSIAQSTNNLTYKNTITPDLFGTNLSSSQLMAISGNENEFAFLTMETQSRYVNTGGFSNNEITIPVGMNVLFGLCNNITSNGSNITTTETITFSSGTYDTTQFLYLLNQNLQSYGLTAEINTNSNFKISYSYASYPTFTNNFSISFLNYAKQAALFGFLPKIYNSTGSNIIYQVTSGLTPQIYYVISYPTASPFPTISDPPQGYVLYISQTTFTIDFDSDTSLAGIFGFDLASYSATQDATSGYYYILSPQQVTSGITSLSLNYSSGPYKLEIKGNYEFSLAWTTADAVLATLLGFSYPVTVTASLNSGDYTLISPNLVNTDPYPVYSQRFEIDTLNPSTMTVENRGILTSSNAFYLPPLPTNWSNVLPSYPSFPTTILTDFQAGITSGPGNLSNIGTYTARITSVDSFNYTNKGGYNFGYTISYDGLASISSGVSNYVWPPAEWWGASKVSSVLDSNTLPYITQPRFIRNTTPTLNSWCNYDVVKGTARQKYFDVPNNPLGNFHIGYFSSATTLAGTTKYNLRDYIPGTSKYTFNPASNLPTLAYVDFSFLSTNIVFSNGSTTSPFALEYPIVQPWGYDPVNNTSTLSTLVNSSVYPRIYNVNLMYKPDETASLSNSHQYGAICTKAYGSQQQFMLAYDFFDINSNSGIASKTYYQYVESRITSNGSNSIDYLFEPATQVIQSYEGSNLVPYDLKTGADGGFWITFNEGNRITASNTAAELVLQYASVWGNRNNQFDSPVSIKNAYQLFYPTQRIVMTKIKNQYDPITDLSGILYPEWPHTNMFVYNSYSNYVADISANKWGMESSNRFMVSDTNFSGTYYNATCLDVPLLPSSNYYYLAVRGYSPTEKSQVMLRFSLPNLYDFGYTRFTDLSNEIFLYPSSPSLFNSNYGNLLMAFNSNFVFGSNGKVFGSNIIVGYNGSNFSNINGFGDFLQEFIGIYNVYNSNVEILTKISAAIQSNINNFITTDLAYILPPNALQRQRYTDPIIYSILWKSALPPQYLPLEDNWGLGWNLGYDKEDTPYDTTHVAQSFYKILDDYINLKLNDEFDMNRMDTGAKENLSATLEPTGTLKAYYGKLLLAPFGSYAQTIISNPVSFQLPIPRMEKITFTWTDNLGNTIDNGDCEWNVVLQIVEGLEPGRPQQKPIVLPR